MFYTQSQWILLFFFYCVVGWIWESCYVSLKERRWVNRGFLYGPWLPIYGSGAIIILAVTLPVRKNLWLVFLLGMVGATALEYVTGAVMERIFHMRYWDYSNQHLNINGYICLSSTLVWGIFSVLLVHYLHLPVERVVCSIPKEAADALGLVLTVLFVVDATKSVQAALDLKALMIKIAENSELLDDAEARLHDIIEKLHQAELNLASRRDQRFQRAVSILKRNPSAASRKYRAIFAELKKLRPIRYRKRE